MLVFHEGATEVQCVARICWSQLEQNRQTDVGFEADERKLATKKRFWKSNMAEVILTTLPIECQWVYENIGASTICPKRPKA